MSRNGFVLNHSNLLYILDIKTFICVEILVLQQMCFWMSMWELMVCWV